jgi:putative nucleotidyltransferase with HDIG domain
MSSSRSHLPSEDGCIEILKSSGAYDLFLNHSRRVQDVALAVCDIASKRGLKVDKELVSVSALLHDVMKHKAVCHHGKEGGDYLRALGYPKVAEVIETHCPEDLKGGKLTPRSVEQKIIFYSDLRVNPGKVVTLDERFDYIREHYPAAESLMRELYSFAKQIEWELLGDPPKILVFSSKHDEKKPSPKMSSAKTDDIEKEMLDREIKHMLSHKRKMLRSDADV